MSFESVYRVSTRISSPDDEDINSLSQALGMELPIGYREYVTSLGLGTLCTFLVVKMANQIRNPERRDEEYYREMFAHAGQHASKPWNAARLHSTDFERATVFAYADAEAPIWFATPTQGTRLFEHVEGDTVEIENGFFG